MFKDLLEKIKRKKQLEKILQSGKFPINCKVVEKENKILCYVKSSSINDFPGGDLFVLLDSYDDDRKKSITDKPIVYVIKKWNIKTNRALMICGSAKDIIIQDSKITLCASDLYCEESSNLIIKNSMIKLEDGAGSLKANKITLQNSNIYGESLLINARELEIKESNIQSGNLKIIKAKVKIKDAIIRAYEIICKLKALQIEDGLSLLNPTEKISLEIEEPSRVSISIPKEGKILCNGEKVEHTGGCLSLQTSSKVEQQQNKPKVVIKPKKITTVELRRKKTFGRGRELIKKH